MTASERLRISALFVVFEAGMPLIGLGRDDRPRSGGSGRFGGGAFGCSMPCRGSREKASTSVQSTASAVLASVCSDGMLAQNLCSTQLAQRLLPGPSVHVLLHAWLPFRFVTFQKNCATGSVN
jgi:hypothetical protein